MQFFVQTHFLMSFSALSQEIMSMYATPFGLYPRLTEF